MCATLTRGRAAEPGRHRAHYVKEGMSVQAADNRWALEDGGGLRTERHCIAVSVTSPHAHDATSSPQGTTDGHSAASEMGRQTTDGKVVQ